MVPPVTPRPCDTGRHRHALIGGNRTQLLTENQGTRRTADKQAERVRKLSIVMKMNRETPGCLGTPALREKGENREERVEREEM